MNQHAKLEQSFVVKSTDLALYQGSGSLPVLATPRLVAWMENTAAKLIETQLSEGTTSVGVEINIQHLKASALDEAITVQAILDEVEGRKFSFSLQATNAKGAIVGQGTHTRFAVDSKKFMAKLN